MRLPGRWLRTAAARLCAKQTMDRVIDPIVADVQTEYEEAMRTRRWWRATWVCVSGYSAFWKAVGLYSLLSGPRSLWSGIAADGWTLGRMIAYSLIAFLSVTLLLAASPMIHTYSPTHPQPVGDARLRSPAASFVRAAQPIFNRGSNKASSVEHHTVGEEQLL